MKAFICFSSNQWSSSPIVGMSYASTLQGTTGCTICDTPTSTQPYRHIANVGLLFTFIDYSKLQSHRFNNNITVMAIIKPENYDANSFFPIGEYFILYIGERAKNKRLWKPIWNNSDTGSLAFLVGRMSDYPISITFFKKYCLNFKLAN